MMRPKNGCRRLVRWGTVALTGLMVGLSGCAPAEPTEAPRPPQAGVDAPQRDTQTPSAPGTSGSGTGNSALPGRRN